MFVLEGDTLQFAVFIEALRSNLSDICSEYQSRQFFIVLESFCCNFRYFKGIAIFRNGCRNGDLISFFPGSGYCNRSFFCIGFGHFIADSFFVGKYRSLFRYRFDSIRCRIWIWCRRWIWFLLFCFFRQSFSCLFQFFLCCVQLFRLCICSIQHLFRPFQCFLIFGCTFRSVF